VLRFYDHGTCHPSLAQATRPCIFVRVSQERQNYERQILDLEKYATDKSLRVSEIIKEKISGAVENKKRKGIQELLEKAKMGKFATVIVSEISRLGRNAFEVQNLIEILIKMNISVFIQSLGIETLDKNGNRSPLTDLMIAIIAQFAQMERSTLIDRIKSGMNRARNVEGKHCGRPKGSVVEKEQILKKYKGVAEDLRSGISVRKVAKIHGVSVNTVLKVKKEMGVSN